MTSADIQLGQQYFALMRLSALPVKELEKPAYVYHICSGFVTSKGVQEGDDGKEVEYAELGGNRLKVENVFATAEECLEFSIKSASEETTRRIEEAKKAKEAGDRPAGHPKGELVQKVEIDPENNQSLPQPS